MSKLLCTASRPLKVKNFTRFFSLIKNKIQSERCDVYTSDFFSVTSGSFLYDARLSLADWQPTPNELRVLSAEMVKLANRALPLERLAVSADFAKIIFENNEFKSQQIPDIAGNSGA